MASFLHWYHANLFLCIKNVHELLIRDVFQYGVRMGVYHHRYPVRCGGTCKCTDSASQVDVVNAGCMDQDVFFTYFYKVKSMFLEVLNMSENRFLTRTTRDRERNKALSKTLFGALQGSP